MSTRRFSPGKYDGLDGVGQLVDVENLDALDFGDAVEVVVGSQDR